MDPTVSEWLNLIVRWIHVVAGAMWIGQTYFFTWLDHTFHNEKQVWMVHSGGFYVVDKQKEPKLLDQTLHWFRWEAAFTLRHQEVVTSSRQMALRLADLSRAIRDRITTGGRSMAADGASCERRSIRSCCGGASLRSLRGGVRVGAMTDRQPRSGASRSGRASGMPRSGRRQR